MPVLPKHNESYLNKTKPFIVLKEKYPRLSLRAWFLLLSLLYFSVQSAVLVCFRTMTSTDSLPQKPHITFGVIADVQYADCDDGTDYSNTRQRFYRNSLNLLKNAINDWKRSADPVAFVLQLGDLIDGKNKNGGEASSKKALLTALQPLESLHIPLCHVLGNHDLYNLNRSYYLTSPLNSSLLLNSNFSSGKFYYTFLPHPKLRIVAIDTYEVSLLGYRDRPDDEHFQMAKAWLHDNNKNADVNDITGLHGLDRRWAAYNGGISETQLNWLSEVLMKAQAKEENVIIITHVALQCLYKDYAVCLTWNYQEIMDIIHQYKCVIGIFAGHEHAGWDHVDDHGIQHITFQGVIETAAGSNAYATARLWDSCLTIAGVGRVPSFAIPLRYSTSEMAAARLASNARRVNSLQLAEACGVDLIADTK